MDEATLREAMEETYVSDATLTEYLPFYIDAMRAAQINTVLRAAAWDATLGHESSGLKYMAEIQTNGPGWTDDRRIYRGRGPIQLTWSSNYRKFGQWCVSMGYCTDSEMFVKTPTLVEQPKWGFLAASWYWLNGGPKPGQINGFADAGDIFSVSRCVNGWSTNDDGSPRIPNGMSNRQERYDNCLTLGERLLPDSIPQEEPMPSAVQGDPDWLEDILRPVLGDKLKTIDGWKSDGVGGTMGVIWGVVWHHTGNAAESAESIAQGRPDLQGPLAQIHIGPDGVVTVVAVGPCNHAGVGSWVGIPTDGANRVTIGIECAFPRDTTLTEATIWKENWPDAQMNSMLIVGAAIAQHLGYGVSHNISHKEWAQLGPAGFRQGKWDPGHLDMNWFRAKMEETRVRLFDGAPVVVPPPVVTPPPVVLDRVPGPADDQLTYRWNQLGGQTLVEAMAEVRDKVLGTTDRGKPGVKTVQSG